MNSDDPIVITSAMRTPLGGFQGALSSMTAVSYTHLTLPTTPYV